MSGIVEEIYIEEGHGDTGGGMPQLDPSSFSSQLFWLTVIFALLYVLMARAIIPRIRYVLEKRQNHIMHDLDAAEKANEEAASAKKLYELELVKARDKANHTLDDMQRQIANMVSIEQDSLSKKLDLLTADSEKKLKAQRNTVNAELEPLLQDVTSLIVESVAKVKPSPQKVDGAVASALKG